MTHVRIAAAAGLAACLLAGCATAPPPAVTAYARQDCAPSPNLSAAISLTPPKPKLVHSVTTRLDAAAACLTHEGGASPYALYALPTGGDTKVFTVGSLVEQARLVPPEVSVLDAQGKVTRRFATADFFFRGPIYSVQFRPRAGETFVLVATDASRIGQKYDSIAIGTYASASYVKGAGPISFHTGVDTQESRTFSYEGAVGVIVNDEAAAKAE